MYQQSRHIKQVLSSTILSPTKGEQKNASPVRQFVPTTVPPRPVPHHNNNDMAHEDMQNRAWISKDETTALAPSSTPPTITRIKLFSAGILSDSTVNSISECDKKGNITVSLLILFLLLGKSH